MATIQVRDISEDAYETIRLRARAAGQSIQAYMRRQVERIAREPDEDELFAEVERFVAAHNLRLDVEALLASMDDGRR